MTEEQQGGTTPEPEANASADQVSEQSVAAVAVADEPAADTEAVEGSASADDTTEAPAPVADANDELQNFDRVGKFVLPKDVEDELLGCGDSLSPSRRKKDQVVASTPP